MTVPGKPGDIRGTITLEQDGADVAQHIDIAVRVSIPLVGGKVEEMIAGFVGRVFDAQNSVGVKWLQGDRPRLSGRALALGPPGPATHARHLSRVHGHCNAGGDSRSRDPRRFRTRPSPSQPMWG